MMTREELQKKLIDAPDSEKINELFDDFQKNVKLDSEVDSWLSKNYQSLKELSPDLGKEAFKAKPSVANSEADLVKMFGLEGDEGAKQLFSTGEKSWAKVPQWRKEQIAKDNGMEWPELKAKLVDANKAYNEKKRKEYVMSMKESEMNPSFLEQPIDAVGLMLAKAFMPNIVENVLEDVDKGEGGSNYFDFVKDQALNHTKDVVTDAFLTGLSFVPVGNLAKAKGLVGNVGRVVIEGVHQGANAAASEATGYFYHDKEFDPIAVMTSAILGSTLETKPKQYADLFKGTFKNSPTAKKVGNAFEHYFTDYAAEAADYMKQKRKNVSKFKDFKNNPENGSFIRNKENYKEHPVSFDDLESSKEAESLYDYIVTGRRPTNAKGSPVSDSELQEMFLRHDPLNELDASKMRGDGKHSFISLKSNIKSALELTPETFKAFQFNARSEGDESKQKAYKKFEEGKLPKDPSDPLYYLYLDWAKKNPEKNAKSEALALFLL